MAYPYTSKYLLTMLLRYLGRPETADAISAQTYLDRLTDAQQQIVADLAGIMPDVLYPTTTTLPTMSTTDSQTFTFGTDANGFALAPIGNVGLYRSMADVPNYPMEPGIDYIPIGATAIQIPNNQTYSGSIYWRGISPPGIIDLSGSHEPVLFPEGARELIALRAAINFCNEAGLNPSVAAILASQYGYPLAGNPGRFAFWCMTWKTSYRRGGALGTITGRQLAASGAYNLGES